VNWLRDQLRHRANSFRENQGLPLVLSPEEQAALETQAADAHIHHLRGIFAQIANSPDPPARVILPMLKGDVEDVAAGMAVLNDLDWMQMTESERQPYREVAADKIIQSRKDAELARQAELEKEGAFDGLDGH
jgi:hypothetical protein